MKKMAILLLALTLFSCKKDKEVDDPKITDTLWQEKNIGQNWFFKTDGTMDVSNPATGFTSTLDWQWLGSNMSRLHLSGVIEADVDIIKLTNDSLVVDYIPDPAFPQRLRFHN